MLEYYTIFIILTFQFQYVLSLRVYKFNNDITSTHFLPKLKQIIDIQRSEPGQYRKNSVYYREKPSFRRSLSLDGLGKTFLGRSRLVSRVIPHGYKGGPYEYDKKLNTIYRPLIRFHLRTPIDRIQELLMKKKPKVLGYVIAVKNKKERKGLRKHKKKVLKNEKTSGDDVNGMNLSKYLRLRLPSAKNQAQAFLTLADKSAEYVDDLEPGVVPLVDSSAEKPKPPVVIPEFPFWNYWTYTKTIHQDDCEGNLVKLGSICIGPAGHRKYL